MGLFAKKYLLYHNLQNFFFFSKNCIFKLLKKYGSCVQKSPGISTASDLAVGPAGFFWGSCWALLARKVSLSFDFSLWLLWTPKIAKLIVRMCFKKSLYISSLNIKGCFYLRKRCRIIVKTLIKGREEQSISWKSKAVFPNLSWFAAPY